MASILKEDLKDFASLTCSGHQYLECIEPYLVQLDAADYAYGAVAALVAATRCTGLPGLWSTHPLALLSNMSAVQVAAEPYENHPKWVLVKVRYMNAAPQIVVRSGCALVIKQSDMDYSGVQIQVARQPTVGADYVIKTATVTWLCPQSTHSIRRVQPAAGWPNAINPVQLAINNVGRVNSTTVSVFGIDMAPGTLLCEAIGADNEGLWGVAYQMDYEFRYDPAGHNPEAVMLDTETGEPYKDLTLDANYNAANPLARVTSNAGGSNAVGRKIIGRQPAMDFTPLFV